ncbi:MAG: hypothetical protein NTY81_03800 [Candidatus Staskawiczbacteria bacterium]|nr:hypothetical protein [Candidatus Staskawiczbacteria bacterium]
MNFNFKEETGFTIIELIISIFVLSVGVIGIFSIFSMVVVLTSDSSDRLTATYLAQEGMEIVRNIRDTNWLHMDICASGVTPLPDGVSCPASWLDGFSEISACSNINTGCEADYTSKTSMSGNSGEYLYINNENGFYGYNQNNATITKFQRKIIISPVEDIDGKSDHIIKVTVEVFWDKKSTILSPGVTAQSDGCGPSNCISTEGTLYDWYNYINH